jgi:vacuolar-type H+-ATPase subunit E/Vma4
MTNKQFQGNKKKARKKSFAEREAKRKLLKDKNQVIEKAVSMEEMAEAMGVKLK